MRRSDISGEGDMIWEVPGLPEREPQNGDSEDITVLNDIHGNGPHNQSLSVLA